MSLFAGGLADTGFAATLPALRAEAGRDAGIAPASVALDVTVTNCNDSGPGSLREAYANATSDVTISLRALACSTISLTTGALSGAAANPGNVTIKGAGQTIDANGAARVFSHNGSGTLILQGLRVINGDHAGTRGGCIYSAGSLWLYSSQVTGCTLHPGFNQPARGGAIYSHDAVRIGSASLVSNASATASYYASAEGGGVWARDISIDRSTIRANSAVGQLTAARGGGVFAADLTGSGRPLKLHYATLDGNYSVIGAGAYVYGSAEASNSTLSGNIAAGNGGGLYVANKPTATTRSHFTSTTFSGNLAGVDGAGLFGAVPVTMGACTLTGNVASRSGGGMFLRKDILLVSSIVALNTAAAAAASDDIGGEGDLFYGDHDLVLRSSLALPGDTLYANPKLGPLTDNGGPTKTHALLPGSPAIDHGVGVPAPEDYDQRGAPYLRTTASAPDIGAFEVQDTIFRGTFDVPDVP
jgi:parallel beta-helix repeat protein